MKHFRNLTDLARANGVSQPAHPQLSLVECNSECCIGETEFTGDFYMIGFKKLKSGMFVYGRTKYDHDNGSMSFVKPRQVIKFENLEFEEKGFIIFFHEDFLNGHPLHQEIKKYGFFEYDANEALHLSPQEEEIIWDAFGKMQIEYRNNPDEYSRDILLGHIETILRYSQRFYKRQFINRAHTSTNTTTKFNQALVKYFDKGAAINTGLPSVKEMAAQLNLSPGYLSDVLKQETGKTAIELIHLHLISEAKNLIKGSNNNIAEVAYTLGFDNLPYFSRLFKKEVGMSPNQFKKAMVMN